MSKPSWRKLLMFSTALVMSGGLGATALGAIIDPEYSRPLLDPALQPQFVNALPNPTVPVFILTPDKTNPAYDYYEVSARQVVQNAGLIDETTGAPLSTTFWGYGDSRPGAATGFHSYPGPTFEVRSNQETRILWKNELPNTSLLPVDTTISCGLPMGQPCPPVRIVTHVHGAHVQGDSDGGPLPWFSPNFAEVSPFWDPNPYGLPGTYSYPNSQEAGTIWYHDHGMGVTHTNVWAGLAGFYLIRDANEDALIAGGVIPGGFPYEVPIAIQDRNFYTDGSLAIPDAPVRDLLSPTCQLDPLTGLVDPLTCPLVLDPMTGQPIPSITPELFGNINLANGIVWPFYDVEPRVYRLRLLNGCDSRTYLLQFSNGMTFYQIGTDQAFLQAPVPLTQIILMPGERVDVLVDFKTATPGSQVILQNLGPEGPFMGLPVDPLVLSNPATTGRVMAFNVGLTAAGDTQDPTTITSLRATPIPTLTPNVPPRKLALMEGVDAYGRLQLLLNGIEFMVYPTELPTLNSTEIWEVANATPDVHPMHLHLVHFQLLDRQGFDPLTFVAPVPATVATPFVPPSWTLVGVPTPPPAQEVGWKDTIQMYPDTVTRIIATFDIAGNYVWHCHILSHEEHDMMRPLIVVTPATGATMTASKTSQPVDVGTPITFTAEGTTNLQTLRSADAFEYEFLVQAPGAPAYTVAQPYSPIKNFIWTPPAVAGFYKIQTRVRAYGSVAAFEAMATKGVTISPMAVPTSPNLLTALTLSSNSIKLTWNDRSYNETLFKISRGLSVAGVFTDIATVSANVTSFTDTGLTANTTYYYRVRATNAVGDSVNSNTAFAKTIGIPAKPQAPVAVALSASSIRVSWIDASANETGFIVTRSLAVAGPYTAIATVGANVTSYTDTGLAAGTFYYYRIKSFNDAGESAANSTAYAKTTSIPAKPTGTAAVALSNSSIRINWTDASTTETSFKISRSTVVTGPYTDIAVVNAGVTSYTDTGLTANTFYYYRVRSSNDAGDSGVSNTGWAKTLP